LQRKTAIKQFFGMTSVWHSLALNVAGKLMGTRFGALLTEMQRAQWLPIEELRERSEARLVPLLRHAAENVPFYRKMYDRLALPSDNFSVRDLLRLLDDEMIISVEAVMEIPPEKSGKRPIIRSNLGPASQQCCPEAV
jgi:hypothetical protein